MKIASRWMFAVLLVLSTVPVTLGATDHETEWNSWLETLTERVRDWLPSSDKNSGEVPKGESKPNGPSEDESGSTCGPGIDPDGCP
ncbi:MAG: hypothetical protein AAF481_18175 [Acidobacteriota bacterium]